MEQAMNILASRRPRPSGLVRLAWLFGLTQIMLLSCSSIDNASFTAASDAVFDVAPPPNFTRGLLERSAPKPLYPIRARNLGVQGWVMLGFSVDADGEVIDNTIQTLDEQPEGFFETSAVSAARRLTFQNVRGEPIEDVRYVFRYQLDGLNIAPNVDATDDVIQFREMLPQRLITPPYPEVALELELEGYVVVKFTVTETGAVQDITIAESEPPGVFNEEAIRSARRLRFEPRIVVGEPVRVEDVLYRFDWKLPR
jgi:TonB family protein